MLLGEAGVPNAIVFALGRQRIWTYGHRMGQRDFSGARLYINSGQPENKCECAVWRRLVWKYLFGPRSAAAASKPGDRFLITLSA